MNTAVRVLVIAAAVMAFIAPAAQAQQNSFSITPPPIATPSFEDGKVDSKLGFMVVTISGNGMDFTGGGVDFIARKAFSNTFAGDIQVGMFGMGGDIKTGTTKESASFGDIYMSLNAELQAIKSGGFSTILFIGPNFSFLGGSSQDTAGNTTSISGGLYGFQGGIQLGITAGDFIFAPFAMVMNQQGSITVTPETGPSTTVTIDPYTTTSLGLDITYKPWNLSLSAILQEAAKQTSKDPEGIKTQIIQLSWHF
jgi:hypothetical protein